ncbi:MAG: hypothetical protein PHU85_00995 [Phycisphaerae bacterium]|nr:hypothetical protein [Phycisphaerae bacterium]
MAVIFRELWLFSMNEPVTIGFLALGGLSMAAAAICRRRRA